jgi:hypothetical protein
LQTEKIRKRMYTLQAELKLEQTQRVNERHQRFKDAMFGVAVYRDSRGETLR